MIDSYKKPVESVLQAADDFVWFMAIWGGLIVFGGLAYLIWG